MKTFRVELGRISIPELGQALRVAGFCAQGLVGFMLRHWLVSVLSVDQGQNVFR